MIPTATNLDAAFAALAHPVRRAIVDRLLERELTVGEIAEPYDMKIPSVSRHLKILEAADLIERAIEGRPHRCRLNPAGIREMRAWIGHYEQFWSEQFNSLERFLEEDQTEQPL